MILGVAKWTSGLDGRIAILKNPGELPLNFEKSDKFRVFDPKTIFA